MTALHEMTQMAQPVACPGSTQPYVLPRGPSVAHLLAPAGAGRRRYEVLSTWARERNKALPASTSVGVVDAIHEEGGDTLSVTDPDPKPPTPEPEPEPTPEPAPEK